MKEPKVKHCADLVDKKNGMKHVAHFMKKDYLKKGHNSGGTISMTSRGDDGGENSQVIYQSPGIVGPDQPRPVDPATGGKWIHDGRGGWTLVDDDASEVQKRKISQGR